MFPVPAVLEHKPTLIGYYRLLLGISQKRFYRAGTGMGAFRSMEERGHFNTKRRPPLESFCAQMSEQLADLVRQISPKITMGDVNELPLLTLGAQFYGGNNNTIGRKATLDVFLSVAEIVKDFIVTQDAKKITIVNASKRKVFIALSTDPDIRIQEEFEQALRNKVAIEIKGGTDVSNTHNRAGEAEKSHQKAKKLGFRDFWTIISKAGLNVEKLKHESPTTNSCSMSLKSWGARAMIGRSFEVGLLIRWAYRCYENGSQSQIEFLHFVAWGIARDAEQSGGLGLPPVFSTHQQTAFLRHQGHGAAGQGWRRRRAGFR